MVMAAVGLLDENPNPTEQEVRLGLEGNLCRCTGYHNIVKAVLGLLPRGRAEGAGMTVTEAPRRPRVIGTRMLRREDPAAAHRRGAATPTTSPSPARCTSPSLRSPYAHARITIDRRRRRRWRCPASSPPTPAPTSRDLWAAPMPCAWPVTEDMKNPPHYPLAIDTACYVGDGVAVVLATSRRRGARRARRRSTSTTTRSPAVIDLEDALSDRVLVHDDLGTNTRYTWELKIGDEARRRGVRRRPPTRSRSATSSSG